MSDLPRGTGHGGGLVIPKSIFGGGADKSLTDVPSPGDASSFALQSTLATIRKETSESPEHKKKYQFLPEEPMISERPNTNQVGIKSPLVLYNRNHYFGLGPILKPKPKLANTFNQYFNRY